jgi:hypothetical protein
MITERLNHPVAHFLIAGAVLFLVYDHVRPADPRTIVVSEDRLAAMTGEFESLHGHAPDEAETGAIIDRYVEDEALFREALALGLADGDVVVRRRLIQNMRFLSEPGIDETQLTEAEVDAWAAGQGSELAEPHVTVTHVYFGDDEAGAREVLSREIDPRALGKPFLAGDRFDGVGRARVDSLFGEGFYGKLAVLEEGRWHGPIQSSHGWHLVRTDPQPAASASSRAPDRSGARRELALSRQREEQARRVEEIVERYEIEVVADGAASQ